MEKPVENSNTNKPKVMEILGEALWVILHSNPHRYSMFVGDLEWLLIAPLMKQRLRLFKDDNQKSVGIAFWANVSEEVNRRLEMGLGKLTYDDWDSGDIYWIVDLISLNKTEGYMIETLRTTVLKDKIFRYQSTTKEGKQTIVTYDGKNNKILDEKPLA